MTDQNNLIRVGTRGSLLARTQTGQVVEQLRSFCPDHEFETIIIKTTGDVYVKESLTNLPGKGFFTKELEDAMIDGQIDLAIHSLKDLPTEFPPGLALGAITKRSDPRDVMVGKIPTGTSADAGLKIGTSSLRRVSQLSRMYPDCEIVNLRGNLDTRIRKARDGEVGCAIVAAAGILRLGQEHEIDRYIDVEEMLPAPAQGALGIEIRDNDERIAEIVSRCHDADTASCVTAERAFLHELGSGCQVPVGSLAELDGDSLTLRGRVASPDGTRCVEGTRTGARDDAGEIGRLLAEELRDKGASEIIDAIGLNQGGAAQ